MSSSFPYPPSVLANYVGRLVTDNPEAEYEELGTTLRGFVKAMLPGDFDLRGGRVLDFGCGAGRVLRHFDEEAASGEVWGCDIDRPSIEWAQENLSPPFQFALSEELPPLPFPDEHFDLIYAISVFTHLLDSWSDWVLELRRILKPGGFLVASFLGRGMTMAVARVPWDEDRIGMIPVKIGTPWSEGGPCVLHSPWWLRAHLGRAFEVTRLAPDGTSLRDLVKGTSSGDWSDPAQEPVHPTGDGGQGMIALRKDDRPAPTRAQLVAPEPDEPREFEAMHFAVSHLCNEINIWRGEYEGQRNRADWLQGRADWLEQQHSATVAKPQPASGHPSRLARAAARIATLRAPAGEQR